MTMISRVRDYASQLWEAHMRHGVQQALNMLPPDLYREVMQVRRDLAATGALRRNILPAQQPYDLGLGHCCECEAF